MKINSNNLIAILVCIAFFLIYTIGLAAIGIKPSWLTTAVLFFLWGVIWKFITGKNRRVQNDSHQIDDQASKLVFNNNNIYPYKTILEIEDLIILNDLINSTRKGYFNNKQNDNLLDFINKIAPDKNAALMVIEAYFNHYGKNLIEELKSLSSNYTKIKIFLKVFIDFEIVNREWPHKFVNNIQSVSN